MSLELAPSRSPSVERNGGRAAETSILDEALSCVPVSPSSPSRSYGGSVRRTDSVRSSRSRPSTQSVNSRSSQLGHRARNESFSSQGTAKRNKMEKTQLFFTQLSLFEKELFTIITEDIPLQSTAGLQNLKRKLFKGREVLNRKVDLGFMLCQIILNLFTCGRTCYLTYYVSSYDIGTILECGHDRVGSCSGKGQWSWILFAQIMCLVESCFLFILVLKLTWTSLFLLCVSDPVEYAKTRYFILMAFPKIASKFSFVVVMHIANFERLKSFILRGEFECLGDLFMDSMARKARQIRETTHEVVHLRMTNKPGSKDSDSVLLAPRSLSARMCHIIGIFFSAVFLVIALHALIVKIALISFAAKLEIHQWSEYDWFLFVGFLNQLRGISMSCEVEMLRVLTFKFGGEDTIWQRSQIEACSTYLSLLAGRLVEVGGRCQGLTTMYVLSSADLQKIFQGKTRNKELAAVREETMRMFEYLNNVEELVALRDTLVKHFMEAQATLDDTLTLARPEDRAILLKRIQSKAIGGLRLAARVQEHIWEWEKVGLLGDDDGQSLASSAKVRSHNQKPSSVPDHNTIGRDASRSPSRVTFERSDRRLSVESGDSRGGRASVVIETHDSGRLADPNAVSEFQVIETGGCGSLADPNVVGESQADPGTASREKLPRRASSPLELV